MDRGKFPVPLAETHTNRMGGIERRIIGLADLLIRLGIPYENDETLRIAEELTELRQSRAHGTSRQLAVKRGRFPAYAGSSLEAGGQRRRRVTITTIAPINTISILTDCSAGIDPRGKIQVDHTAIQNARLEQLHLIEFLKQARARGLSLEHLRVDTGAWLFHSAEIPRKIDTSTAW
ncbi:MAG: hypothetical protein NNA20_02510 [Nitrospira sp.]|nr:hypothetical protein [Nitrospira sp.]